MNIGFEIDKPISAEMLISRIQNLQKRNPDAKLNVVLRKTEGTDFPPCIVVEDDDYGQQCEKEGFVRIN